MPKKDTMTRKEQERGLRQARTKRNAAKRTRETPGNRQTLVETRKKRARRKSSNGLLVPLGSTRYRASTCGLSRSSSTTTLNGRSNLEVGFALRCFQRLSLPGRGYPAVHLAVQPVNQRSVQHGPLVLVSAPRKSPTPTIDRDRTVSRRSEPSSRATLMGEQPNPWDLLQPQDVTSRHRGAKPLRRFELLGAISLLSPEYLLSFERWPFHAEPPDHYALVSYLIDS
jgi:hypothetical protein